jgi:integrase
VFTTKNGDPRYPSNVYAQYKKLLKQTGLPDITLHDLRRTWATLSIEAGVRIEQAQEALGHESIETTKNIYVTAVPALARRAFETFDEYFTAQKSSELRLVEKEPF